MSHVNFSVWEVRWELEFKEHQLERFVDRKKLQLLSMTVQGMQ